MAARRSTFAHRWTATECGRVKHVQTACPLKHGQRSMTLVPALAKRIFIWCLFPWRVSHQAIHVTDIDALQQTSRLCHCVHVHSWKVELLLNILHDGNRLLNKRTQQVTAFMVFTDALCRKRVGLHALHLRVLGGGRHFYRTLLSAP